MKDETNGVKPNAAVRPLFVTTQNAESATGENFRFWKSNYPHLVRRVGRKAVIVAAELERAVQQSTAHAVDDVQIANADPAEEVRAILRRAGAHFSAAYKVTEEQLARERELVEHMLQPRPYSAFYAGRCSCGARWDAGAVIFRSPIKGGPRPVCLDCGLKRAEDTK